MPIVGRGLTGRTRAALVAAVAVLLLGSVVALAGTDDGGGPAASPPMTVAVPDPAGGGDVGSASTTTVKVAPTTTVPAAKPVKKGDTVALPPTPTTQVRNDYVYEVTLEPTCAHPGDSMTATLHLKPQAAALAVPLYNDGESYGTSWTGFAPDDGIVRVTWTAAPAMGEGILRTGATEPGTDRAGNTTIPFRIVEPTKSC